MDQQTLDMILDMYPNWVTQDQVDEALRSYISENIKSRSALSNIKGEKFNPKEVIDAVNAYTKRNNLGNKIKNFGGESLKLFERDTDALQGVARMGEELANIAGEATNSVNNWGLDHLPYFNQAVTGARMAASTAAAGAGLVGLYGMLINEQEKASRIMIDLGITSNNLADFTVIREKASDLGFMLNSALKTVQDYMPLIANSSPQGSVSGLRDFFDITRSQIDNDKLGYDNKQLTSRLLQEAESLRMVSDIDLSNATDRKRIQDAFIGSTLVATHFAEKTGDSREAILAARMEAMQDVELNRALFKNNDFIAEKLGEEGAENIKYGIGLVSYFMTKIPSLKEETMAIMSRAVNDFNNNQTVVDNIPAEFNAQMLALGPELAQTYYDMLDMAINGEVTPYNSDKLTQTFLTFANQLRDGAAPIGTRSDVVNNARQIFAEAQTIEQSFLDMKLDDINFTRDKISEYLSSAATTVDSMDNVRIAYASVANNFTPGFDTTGKAIAGFGVALSGIEVGLRAFYGIADREEDQKRKQETVDLLKRFSQGTIHESMVRQLNADDTELMNRLFMQSALNEANVGYLGTSGTMGGFGSDMYVPGNAAAKPREYSVDKATAAAQIQAALKEQGISDPRAIANILAMVEGESGFKITAERGYGGTSNARIRQVLESRARYFSDTELTELKSDNVAFFNAMYGAEQKRRRQAAGAGPKAIANADLGGFEFRGRGYIQITGRGNYAKVGKAIGVDLVSNPDLLLEPETAAKAVAAFYSTMSQRTKEKLIDFKEVYRVTYGAYPTAGKMDDFNKRMDASNYWYGQLDELSLMDLGDAEISDYQPSVSVNGNPVITKRDYDELKKEQESGKLLSTEMQTAVSDYERRIEIQERISPALSSQEELILPENAPPRPKWYDVSEWNGYIPTSKNSGQGQWDQQYGEYFNPDGTRKVNIDIQEHVDRSITISQEMSEIYDEILINLRDDQATRETTR
jgi:putative chitinase